MNTLVSIGFMVALGLLAGLASAHTCASVRTRPEAPTCASVGPGETVVLLHGLARSSRSMNKLARELAAEGYTVINHGYPSRSATVEVLAKDIFEALEARIAQAPQVHFVTHSMGGIVLREHLEHNEIPNLGRVVMLAPPSRGSEVPDKLGWLKPFQWINGPAGNQLGTGSESRPLRQKPPAFELGIIAGDRSINPILSMLIPGKDDGKVSLARVKPATYTDYVQLHATHPCISRNRKAIAQTKYFLEHGMFKHEGDRP
ncbi:esterase/lipase family protein [Pontiella sp.]|uniref:esterase/lipase family protein n=1 Tax=Pontiella sp. TaxID=2837462 RepID=UPI00356298C5